MAICGLVPGAGTTTLSVLVASGVAQERGSPVLLCDAGSNGIAARVGASSPRSLAGVANAIAADEALDDGVFVDVGPCLRLIAASSDDALDANPDGLCRVLSDARHAHQLTVVDCGTGTKSIERTVLALATEVVWTLPVNEEGPVAAMSVLERHPVRSTRNEIVAAVADRELSAVPFEVLDQVAGARQAPLVFVPQMPPFSGPPDDAALDYASAALDAVDTVIRRHRRIEISG
jgi:MinD-like ATPase involved in chromosome partitioning or flagellar assembly